MSDVDEQLGRRSVVDPAVTSAAALTPRQLEVLRLRATGLTHVLVAAELGIRPNTVRNHLTDAFARLEVSGVLEAFVALGWLRAGGQLPSATEGPARRLGIGPDPQHHGGADGDQDPTDD